MVTKLVTQCRKAKFKNESEDSVRNTTSKSGKMSNRHDVQRKEIGNISIQYPSSAGPNYRHDKKHSFVYTTGLKNRSIMDSACLFNTNMV